MGFGSGGRSGWRRESMGTRSCSFTFYKVLMEFDGFAACCWGLAAAVAGGYTRFPMDLVAYVSMPAHIFSLEIWTLLYPGHCGDSSHTSSTIKSRRSSPMRQLTQGASTSSAPIPDVQQHSQKSHQNISAYDQVDFTSTPFPSYNAPKKRGGLP